MWCCLWGSLLFFFVCVRVCLNMCFECAELLRVCARECVCQIITIFNILWHSNFIHVVRATHWKTRHCCIFHRFCFALSLPRSLAYFHVSHVLLASLVSLSRSLCLPSLSVCLSFALSSCRVHTVQCVLFLNEAFFSCSQPVSFAEARTTTSWLWLYGGHTEKARSWHLKARERNREKEMRQKNIQWHSRGYYSYRCALAQTQRAAWYWLSLFSPFSLWRHALRLWNIAQPITLKLGVGNHMHRNELLQPLSNRAPTIDSQDFLGLHYIVVLDDCIICRVLWLTCLNHWAWITNSQNDRGAMHCHRPMRKLKQQIRKSWLFESPSIEKKKKKTTFFLKQSQLNKQQFVD